MILYDSQKYAKNRIYCNILQYIAFVLYINSCKWYICSVLLLIILYFDLLIIC